jgi:hypothetical protein
LGHGGDSGTNYKPNYLSVMNYFYQLNGLPTIGDNEADRYYQKHGCTGHYETLTNPASGSTASFIIDYSHGEGNSLDEVNGIIEANGFNHPASNSVDFDCDFVDNETLTNFDVTSDGINAVITDHNDWANLNIIFYKSSQGQAGISSTSTIDVPLVNPLFDDIQPVAEETVIFR